MAFTENEKERERETIYRDSSRDNRDRGNARTAEIRDIFVSHFFSSLSSFLFFPPLRCAAGSVAAKYIIPRGKEGGGGREGDDSMGRKLRNGIRDFSST